MMTFWGLNIKPNTHQSTTLPEDTSLTVNNVALVDGEKASLMMKFEDEEILIATLLKNKVPSATVNIDIPAGSPVDFSIVGDGSVSLIGVLAMMPEMDEDDLEGLDEEDMEDEEDEEEEEEEEEEKEEKEEIRMKEEGDSGDLAFSDGIWLRMAYFPLENNHSNSPSFVIGLILSSLNPSCSICSL